MYICICIHVYVYSEIVRTGEVFTLKARKPYIPGMREGKRDSPDDRRMLTARRNHRDDTIIELRREYSEDSLGKNSADHLLL